MAADVLRGLDSADSGYVSAHEVQAYLQTHARLRSLGIDDVHLLLADPRNGGGGQEARSARNNGGSHSGSDEIDDGEGGRGGLGRLLDQAALREVLSRPAHHGLASRLHRFAEVQQQLAGRRAAARGLTTAIATAEGAGPLACGSG